MKNATKKLLIAAALVSMSSVAIAMGPYGGSDRGYGRDKASYMAEKLDLTDEQQQKVKDIMKAQREKAKAFRDNHRQETEEKISKVLTGEQMDKFKEMKANRGKGKGHKGRYGEGRRGGKPCGKDKGQF